LLAKGAYLLHTNIYLGWEFFGKEVDVVKGEGIKMLKEDHGFHYAYSSVWLLTSCILKSHCLGKLS
jgi:hypothetical protein